MDVIFPEMRYQSMESSLQKRVKMRMDELKMNALQTAKKAQLGDSFVRDILRGRTRSPSAENLSKLADALEVDADWLTGRKESSDMPPPHEVDMVGMEVAGTIQAGAWLDASIMPDEDDESREMIPVVPDHRFRGMRQYALAVVGDSMNKEYPDGSWVTCVDFYESGRPIAPGLTVHVERRNGPLTEVTLKRIEMIDGKMVLAPQSTNPKHLPIELNGDGGTEIVIKGLVTGSYRRSDV